MGTYGISQSTLKQTHKRSEAEWGAEWGRSLHFVFEVKSEHKLDLLCE